VSRPATPAGANSRVTRLPNTYTEQDYSNDPEEVADWFFPHDNIGVTLGPSKLLVIDPDRHQYDGVAAFTKLCKKHAADGEWPDTLTVYTAGGGYHLYFQNPRGYRTTGALPKGIDVKGDGGLVVAPGSRIDGKYYTVENDAPVAELPEWLEKLITGSKPDAARKTGSSPRQLQRMPPDRLQKKIEGILNQVAEAGYGERNMILHWAACRMREIVDVDRIPVETAEDYLLQNAYICGLAGEDGERAVLATIRSGLGWGA
jgi:hypothetical protein